MTFNPNSPQTVGVEWKPRYFADTKVTRSTPLAWKWTASANTSYDLIQFGIKPKTVASTDLYGLEIYPDGTFPSTEVTTRIIRPSGDFPPNLNATWWNGAANSTVNIFNGVNGATQVPVALPGGSGQQADDDFIYSPFGYDYDTAFTYPNIAAALAGRHILRVRQVIIVQPYVIGSSTTGNPGAVTVVPWVYPGTTIRNFGPRLTVSGAIPGGHRVEYEWDAQFQNYRGSFWDPTTVGNLNTNYIMGWTVARTNSSSRISAVLQQWVEVDHVPETRVGLASLLTEDPASGVLLPGDHPNYLTGRNVRTPAGVANFTASAGQSYRMEIRRLTANTTDEVFLREFIGSNNNGTDFKKVHTVEKLNMAYNNNAIPTAATAASTTGNVSAGSVLLSAALANSVDSQVYYTDRMDPKLGILGTVSSLPNPWSQTLTIPGSVPANTPYSMVKFLVSSSLPTGPDVGSSLNVQIKTVAGAPLSSVATLTAAEYLALTNGLADDIQGYHEVELRFSTPALLTGGVQYRVDISTSSPGNNQGWLIRVLNGQGGVFSPNQTFGGATDRFYYNNFATPSDYDDIALTIKTVPAVPLNFAVDVNAINDCYQTLRLSWNSPGGTGNGYELQRSDTSSSGPWNTIANMNGLNATSFLDVECKVNTPSYYRVRTTRAFDGAASDWTSVVSGTAIMNCCGYIFTTNSNDDLFLVGDDIGSPRDTTYEQNVQLVQFYGHDGQVAFHDSEFRGARFSRRLLIAADTGAQDQTLPTPTPGQQTFFNELFAITRPYDLPQPIPSNATDEPVDRQIYPYVCVIDQHDRWFATVLTPSVTVQEQPGWYLADVEVIEVTQTPFAVTSDGCTQGGVLDVYLMETGCSILQENNDYLIVDI